MSRDDLARALREATELMTPHIKVLLDERVSLIQRAEDEYQIRCAVEDEVQALKQEILELRHERDELSKQAVADLETYAGEVIEEVVRKLGMAGVTIASWQVWDNELGPLVEEALMDVARA